MDINIVSGKSSVLCLDKVCEILKGRDKTKKHIILAPDRCLFTIEQKLFEKTGESCFFDIEVMSFSQLCKKNLASESKKILTKQSGVALVKKLLLENEEHIRAFRKSIHHIGFAENLFETICLYKSCNISPQDMYVDDSLSLANLKQQDIKYIYTLYENYLQSEYTDSFNQLKLFAKSINKNTFENTCFYLVEYEDFTSLMYEIIYKISKHSDGIYIACTYGKKNNNSNIYSNKVYMDLIDIYKVNGLEYKLIEANNFSVAEKEDLANNLFAFNINKSLVKPNIDINSFNNITDEIKYIVADLYSLCLNNNLNFSQIALVVPSILEYRNQLTLELDKYDIPYYFDESSVISTHILIRTLFDILNILNNNFTTVDFVGLLKSSVWGFDIGEVCTYDNMLKQTSAMPYQCFYLDNVESNSIIEFINQLKDFALAFKDAKNNNDFVSICYQIFNFIVNKSNKYFTELNPLQQRIFTQVIRKFEMLSEDFAGVFGKLDNNADDFVEIYYSYFESTNISLPPISSNTLFIADANGSYINTADYIYILGCNEGKLPKFNLDNGLVTDDEIARLPNAKKINPTIKMLNERKLFKLFDLCLKYNNKLNLSYCLSNSEGSLYPNTLITSITKLFDVEVNFASFVLNTIEKSLYDIDINNVVFNNLNDKIALNNIVEYVKNWEVYNDKVNYRKVISTLLSSNDSPIAQQLLLNYNKKAKIPPVVNAEFFNKNKTSVSQVECFYSCPYKHFARYGLKLRESVNVDIKPNDIGTIIHEVLKETLPYILKNKNDETEILSFAKATLDKVLHQEDNLKLVQNVNNKYVIKSLYNELERICFALINYVSYSNFSPQYYEYRFNSGDYKIKNIAITGAIDRVDCNDGEFLIIDYKTGSNSFSNYNDVYSGKKLQLLVYAKFFADKIKKNPAGVFYLPLSNAFSSDASKTGYILNGVMIKDDSVIKNIDTRLVEPNYTSDIVSLKTTKDGDIYNTNTYKYMCLDRNDFNYLLDYAINQVNIAIDRISAGEITPNPLVESSYSSCTYCEYKSICKYLGDNDRVAVNIQSIEELKNTGEKDGEV